MNLRSPRLVLTFLASLVVGTLIGANAVERADVLAYSGVNPSITGTTRSNPSQTYRNARSILNELLNGQDPDMPSPRQASEPATNDNHQAAPVADIREECEGTTHQRLTRCLDIERERDLGTLPDTNP